MDVCESGDRDPWVARMKRAMTKFYGTEKASPGWPGQARPWREGRVSMRRALVDQRLAVPDFERFVLRFLHRVGEDLRAFLVGAGNCDLGGERSVIVAIADVVIRHSVLFRQ